MPDHVTPTVQSLLMDHHCDVSGITVTMAFNQRDLTPLVSPVMLIPVFAALGLRAFALTARFASSSFRLAPSTHSLTEAHVNLQLLGIPVWSSTAFFVLCKILCGLLIYMYAHFSHLEILFVNQITTVCLESRMVPGTYLVLSK